MRDMILSPLNLFAQSISFSKSPSTLVTPLVNELMSDLTQDPSNYDSKDSTLSHQGEEVHNLVPDGDVILVVSLTHEKPKKRFLVSTAILSLASRYFDRLFNGDMAEA